MQHQHLHELDQFEDALIERYHGHPVLARITRLTEPDFAEVMLQRRFLSLAFTPAYDLAIDLLRDEEGLRIARVILREEYPDAHGQTPSHREDVKEDLYRLGISRAELVASRPTPATSRAIQGTFELIAEAGAHEDADLRLLTILRFWGEILVSVEYERLWQRLEERFTENGRNVSRFYHPHLVHDAKSHPLATVSLLSGTHADRLATRLSEMLTDAAAVAAFKESEERALALKTAYYDQFGPALGRAG
ncbi:hypothetical protein GCM10009801_02720 [Streptomyces albiaxialis]|uniref:Thiaminase-2/PQQC domain-containing protein n=1 Tax=Streptomyces albiaxialis TaxID=329523 RepID=A0ABP5GYU3_9ACTN